MQLYLIPPDGGQGEGAPKRRRRPSTCVSLTPQQRKRLRAALRNLRATYGTWKRLAEAMDVSILSLRGIAKGRDPGSPAMALRAAKAAGTTVDQLLGGLVVADRCPTCGGTRGAP